MCSKAALKSPETFQKNVDGSLLLFSLFTKFQQIYQKRLKIDSKGGKHSYSIEHPQLMAACKL